MDFDKSEKITALTLRLVKKLAGENASENRVNQLFNFSMRLMAGNALTTDTVLDDLHISEMVQRKLAKDDNAQKALQFADLSRRLSSKRTLEKPWALIYVLCKISDSPQVNWVPTSLPSLGDGALLKRSHPTSRFSTTSPEINTQPPSVFLNNTPYNNNNNNSYNTNSYNSTNLNTNNTNGTFGYSYNYNYNNVVANKTQSTVGSGITENTSFEVPEGALIRDVIYVFQAIDGKYVKYDSKRDMYIVDPNVGVSKPVRDLVTRLCELGWLYRRVKLYIDENATKVSIGLIHQSLCAALQQELTDYYRVIAVLEAQINQLTPTPHPHLIPATPTSALTATSSSLYPIPPSHPPVSNGAGSLTLRRLAYWSQGPLQNMRLLAIIADGLTGLRGGAIISFLECHTRNGDPEIRKRVVHLMKLACAPFYKMVRHWVFEGELEDPFSEFFVASDPSVPLERVWYAKYTLRKEMIPSFIPLPLANKILLIGKSINFIRQCCKDTTWVTDARVFSEDTKALSYGSTELFEALIRDASTRSSKRLIEIMLEKFKFLTHCTAIKRYLLLGQGDFTQHLMDLIGNDLLQPAVQIFRHNLNGILEMAVRQSNSQYEEQEVLDRLDIKLLEPPKGGTGWDVFSLDYHVDTPINSVFTPEVMGSYLHIFQFLWNIKRVEHSLSGTWRRQMTSSHHLDVGSELQYELHKCNLIRNEMLHFISNLQYYIMFEVLESSWSGFMQRVKTAQDLDELIAAHTTYLAQIINNTFLSQETQSLRTLLQKIFWTIIRFSRVQENIYSSVDEEAELRKEKTKVIEKKTKSGKWGVTKTHAEQEAERIASQRRQFSPELRNQVANLTNEYHNLFATFQDSLSSIHLTGEINIKFLTFRLDFNEFYHSHRGGSVSGDSFRNT
eukprot:Phypoly_transcript_01522.p1 GENE.Phypoly_transcript_01522~~Phypoly_transcript_01522.p1  ORF type:complete len:898 (+),score=123.02 Phypoly_transcript_01522:59-2752(+)